MKRQLLLAWYICFSAATTYAAEPALPPADPNAPAELTITNTVLRRETRFRLWALGVGANVAR